MRLRISVVTPTKDRPEAVELCQRWFRQQSHRAHEHLIIEGGTHVENLLEGIQRAEGDAIVLADDDDYYGPGWLAWIASTLRVWSLVGQVVTASFHIRARSRRECRVGPLPGTMAFRRCESRSVLDQIRAVDSQRLVRRLGKLSAAAQVKVLDALAEIFAP